MLEFAIIGAGFGGIAMARALDAVAVPNWGLFEKADEVGGTWRENHYPGAACDVPSLLYNLANAPTPPWSRLYPRQPEIQAYLRGLAQPLVDSGRVRLGAQLRSARWCEQSQCWELSFVQGKSVVARSLIMAVGGLHQPAMPQIDGLDSCACEVFHSARWRHEVDLRAKQVVVVGTGASAIQFVPEIAKQAAQLSVCQRTPAWLMPRADVVLWPRLQRAFERWPWLRESARAAIFFGHELVSSALIHRRSGFWWRGLARRHLHRQVADPLLRQCLTPDYAIGCKRVLVSSDYYPTLQRANVELVTTPIQSVAGDRVIMADGREIRADVLILGTGFRPLDVLTGMTICGRDGRSLQDDWQSRPQAYLGISPHGFPNLHFLLGPNTALGHNSVLYMIDSQVEHIIRLLQERRRRGTHSAEATERAQRGYLSRVDAAFDGSAWNGGCHSWYLNEHGQNIALWTGSAMAYRRLTRSPRWEAYCYV